MSKVTVNLNPPNSIQKAGGVGGKVEYHAYFPNELKRLETLGRGNLWSSNPAKFNDPFELDIVVDTLLLGSVDKPSQLIQAYVQNIHHKAGNSKFLVRDTLIELIQMHLSSETGKFKNQRDFKADFRRYLVDELKHYGVTCFSTRPDNELMWAYYAAGHRGFVVTFEVDVVPFALNRKQHETNGSVRMLHNVDYRTLRPQIDLWKILFTNCIKDIFATKSVNWSHEKEARLINRFDTPFADENGFEIPLPFGFRIKSITAGAKTSAHILKGIKDTAVSLSTRFNSSVSVIQQNVSKVTYKMTYK